MGDIEKIAGRLSDNERAVLLRVCDRAPSRHKPEWLRISDETYARLRRMKLIGGVTSQQPDFGDRGEPWRLCYARPVGTSLRAHLLATQGDSDD